MVTCWLYKVSADQWNRLVSTPVTVSSWSAHSRAKDDFSGVDRTCHSATRVAVKL